MGAGYIENSTADFYNPFRFAIDPMDRLLLVNFTKDPDEIYVGFEPQVFSDASNYPKLLVIGWRKDGRVDVYHEAGLNPDPATYDITGKGLNLISRIQFERSKFEVTPRGVWAEIIFRDNDNRMVEINILERNHKKRKPFGLLAPMGATAEKPSALPLIFLENFYFVRKKHTDFVVKVGERFHSPDELPFPIDWNWMYFTRYAENPFIVTWNPEQNASLNPIYPHKVVKDANGQSLELVQAGHAWEIKSITAEHGSQQVRLSFEPHFPQFNLLQDHAEKTGRFTIQAHTSTGKIEGQYRVIKREGQVEIQIELSGGWIPRPDRWELRLMYRMAKIFTQWPKSYLWKGIISFKDPGMHMESKWIKDSSKLEIPF